MSGEHATPAPAGPLAPIADAVTTALAEVSSTNSTITQHLTRARELAAQFKDVAFDVTTTKGMEAAKNARLMLRQERYPIQERQKAGSKLLGTMQRQFNQRCEEIVTEITGYETPIHQQIEAEETRKEAEREKARLADQARKDGHMAAIQAISRMVTEAMGLDSAALEASITAARDIIVDEGYEEYQGQAQQAKDETLRQLQGMLVAVLAEEQEARELAEEKERLAQFKLQQQEQQAKLDADRAAFEAEKAAEAQRRQEEADERARVEAEHQQALQRQQDELAAQQRALDEQRAQQERAQQERRQAVQARIDRLATTGAAYSHMAPSGTIYNALEELRSISITADLFDDRMSEAMQVKDAALSNLQHQHAEALAREVEEARQQQAARIEELIASIRGMGEMATLSVEDGSANLEGLRAERDKLVADAVTRTVYGDRTDEAAEVQRLALDAINDAIRATEERDRLAAEEAERQRVADEAEAERVRLEQAEQMAALALRDAKCFNGELLYEHLRALVLAVDNDAALPWGATAAASRALLVRINPAEDFED